jgi:hypothetical protein
VSLAENHSKFSAKANQKLILKTGQSPFLLIFSEIINQIQIIKNYKKA